MRHSDVDKEDIKHKLEWIMADKEIDFGDLIDRVGIGYNSLKAIMDPNDPTLPLTKTLESVTDYIKRNYKGE